MPSQDFTSSTSWAVPFAVTNITVTGVGGGGGGNRDCDDDNRGSGGGGGGYAKANAAVSSGNVSITVGSGGGSGACDVSAGQLGGGDTVVRAPNGVTIIYCGGGGGGTDDGGGGGGGSAGGNLGGNSGGSGQDDDSGRRGGGAGQCSRSGGEETGGQGQQLDGGCTGDAGGRDGRNYGGGGAGNDNSSAAGFGGAGAVRLEWTFQPPTISASGSTQTSGSSGNPSNVVTISWSSTYATSITISEGVHSTNQAVGSHSFNAPLQSVAGSNSPACKNYTVTASGPGGSASATATVCVYNDNTPNNFSVPSNTTLEVPLSSLEPNTQYTVALGTITGIDMVTRAVSNTSGLQLSNNNSNYSSEIFITNGQPVYLRFTSEPFNTDISGLTTEIYGKTNSRSYSFSVGTLTKSFTATTRGPRYEEVFNFPNNDQNVPYPDIDTIPGAPDQYMISSTSQVTEMNDIEYANPAGVEIRTNRSDAEVRIKKQGSADYGGWQSTRAI